MEGGARRYQFGPDEWVKTDRGPYHLDMGVEGDKHWFVCGNVAHVSGSEADGRERFGRCHWCVRVLKDIGFENVER